MTSVQNLPQRSSGSSRRSGLWITGALLLLMLGMLPETASARQAVIPRIDLAEFSFDLGIQAYREAQYDQAYRHFTQVINDFPLNRKTTAALLMGGQSLYQLGRYQEAIDLLDILTSRYPDSGYISEAAHVRTLAREQMEVVVRPLNVGIVLPLRPEDRVFSQALFNGIRLAVEEHNQTYPAAPVRLIFRDSEAGSQQAGNAVRSLAQLGVDVIIGPLYSEEAVAAGGMAEEARVPLIAPLATEDAVSAGREYVFQANPTFAARGRVMARYAVERLRYNRVAVVSEQGTFGEQMALAYRAEAQRLGSNVVVFETLSSNQHWGRLGEFVNRDLLAQAGALYLPATGQNAPASINAALTSLSQMVISSRVLGNAEWHEVANRVLASRFRTVYTNDFFVDETSGATASFISRYRSLSGQDPDRLGFAGYDVAGFVVAQVHRRQPGLSFLDLIRTAPQHQGTAHRIDFRTGNVNEAMFLLGYRDGGIIVVE